jgi:hypothetical protein
MIQPNAFMDNMVRGIANGLNISKHKYYPLEKLGGAQGIYKIFMM